MKITKIIGLSRSDTTGTLTIACKTDQGDQSITIPRDQIVSMLSGIVGMPLPKSGHPIDYGTIRPSSIQPFQDQDGTTGLCVFLGDSFALPIAFPPASIPQLRQNIDEMELLAATPRGSA